MVPSWTLSRVKWQSISMCLDLSWKLGLEARWTVAWLWQKTSFGPTSMPNSFKRVETHMISLVRLAKAWCSVSAKERDTVCCCFNFHEMREFPKNTQWPIVERRVSRQLPQSASGYAFKEREKVVGKKNPWPGEHLRYPNRHPNEECVGTCTDLAYSLQNKHLVLKW